MFFYPAEPLDDSIPQAAVWNAVRQAFGQEEGVAYYRFPISDAKGFALHEADILIALRHYGLFVLEVKGYCISNITGIQGHVWQTQNWYTSEEHPLKQVMAQVFALKKWLPELPAAGGKPYVQFAIALPFITDTEWYDSPWSGLPTTQAVRPAGKLTPTNLQEWVRESAASPRSTPLSDQIWLQLQDALGGSLYPHVVMPPQPPLVLKVSGLPLTNEKIWQQITGLPGHEGLKPSRPADLSDEEDDMTPPFLYVVATAFLDNFRGREQQPPVRPSLQLPPIPKQDEVAQSNGQTKAEKADLAPLLLFEPALRHLMGPWLLRQGLQLPIVTSLERVYLQKAIKQLVPEALGDQPREQKQLRDQLLHDVATWLDVLKRLDEEGVDLAAVGENFKHRLVQPEMLRVLQPLQHAFHQAYPANELSFERAARQFIAEGLQVPPLVIMEGFSFFKPQQVQFVQRCYELGAQIVLLHAYRPEQKFGFEVLTHSYSAEQIPCFAAKIERQLEADLSVETDLDFLTCTIFSDTGQPQPAKADSSVTVEAFAHRHAEVRQCVERIAELLRYDGEGNYLGYQPRDIRVVTRDADAYRSLLLEEAELYAYRGTGIRYPLPPNLFEVPARQLLLTPLGRFVLTLYEIWLPEETEHVQLTTEQFITILSSGLLRLPTQDLQPYLLQSSAKRFAACREQVFANCRTPAQWDTALTQLESLRNSPAEYHLPSGGIAVDDVRNWRAVLKLIVTLCHNLFATPDRSVARHIQALQAMLNTFNSADLANRERALLSQIQQALTELESAHTAPISTVQFREVINGLVTERNETLGKGNKVAIMAPEGLDNSRQPVVFLLGADSMRLPRAYAEPWPFYDLHIATHLAHDRYLFLAALRATVGSPGRPARFYLSYPRTDNNQLLQPSPYVEEVQYLLQLPSLQVYPEHELPGQEDAIPLLGPDSVLQHPRDFEHDPYRLAELLQHNLCPYRYQLARLTTRGSFFSTAFQLRALAVGVWIHLLLDAWQRSGEQARTASEFIDKANQFKESTRLDVENYFLGFTEQDWIEVERQMLNTLHTWARGYAYDDAQQLVAAPTISVVLPSQARQVKVDLNFCVQKVPGSRQSYPEQTAFIQDIRILTWLQYGQRPESTGDDAPDDIGQFQQVDEFVRTTDTVFRHATWTQSARPTRKAEETKTGLDQRISAIKQDIQTYIDAIEQGQFVKNPGTHCQLCPNNPICLGVALPDLSNATQSS
jgi:hypothetical protein